MRRRRGGEKENKVKDEQEKDEKDKVLKEKDEGE